MDIRIRMGSLEPPAGEATTDGGATHGFTGWLELLSVLERLCQEPSPRAVASGTESTGASRS